MGKKKAGGSKDNPALWERFPAGEELAAKLRPAYHKHLEGLAILCFSKPEAAKSRGKINVAKAMKATPILKAALRHHKEQIDYLIVVGLDEFKPMDAKTKEAVIDHELCHFMGPDDKGNMKMRGHDVEEFTEILERHGAWDSSRYYFAKAAQSLQLGLPGTTVA